MAVVKEFKCRACDSEFEGLLPICPDCGEVAQRAFRTPVSINSAKTKHFDQTIESEMRVRGMTNYSNSSGVSRPTFSGTVQHGHVRGSWGPEALNGYVTASGVPLAPPPIQMAPVQVQPGQNVRNQAGVNRIMNRSVSLGRTDMHGHQLPLEPPK